MNAKSASTWSGRVLGRENLEDYTRWLHELRDYVFAHGSLCGELMDHHLIGEPVVPGVPEVPGGPAAPEDVSQQVIGIDAGTRRQIHSCKSYEEDHQIAASKSYASRGIMCGDMPMRLATMSQAQVQRFFQDIETQNALYWRREHFLWELLSHATSGAILEGVEALGLTATAYQRVKKMPSRNRVVEGRSTRSCGSHMCPLRGGFGHVTT